MCMSCNFRKVTFLDGNEVCYLQTDPVSEVIPCIYRRLGNFREEKFLSVKVSSSYIFIARAHRQKVNAPKISLRDKPVELCMRKRHTELVCCLSRVRKRATYDDLEDNRRVSCTAAEPSSLRRMSQYMRHQ